MTQNLATLVNSVNDAQRRLSDSTRRTPEWRDAQRVAVRARLDYWNAMCLAWDVRHPRIAATGEAPGAIDAVSARGIRDHRSMTPAPRLARTAADAAQARRGFPSRAARGVARSALA